MSPMWNITPITSSSGGTVSAKSAWEIYSANKERRQQKRAEEGSGQHHGVPLLAEQVSVLRDLEDAIRAEIVQQKPEGNKINTFIERGGNVVELYVQPEYHDDKIPLTEIIARITTLEGIGLRGFGKATSLAPLNGLANLKRLAFQSKARAEYPMILVSDVIAGICGLSRLEELNIAGVELDPTVLDQHITRLKNLKKLNISGIHFPHNNERPYQPPKNIGQVSSLEEIAISHIRVSSRPAFPSGLENLPNIKIVHMDAEQNEAVLSWGKLKAKLEQNNPAAYPKKDLKAKGLGFLKSLASGTQSLSDKAKAYQDSLPDVLKKGFSGITF